jgi:SulP family sulfate permease
MFSALDGITGINTSSVNFFYQRLYLLVTGWADLGNYYTLLIGGVTILTGWLTKASYPRAYLIFAIFTGYLASVLVHIVVPQLETQVEFIGTVPFSLFPFKVPNIDFENMGILMSLFDSALIIALIGLATSMVIIKDIKIQKKQQINNEKEVFAQAVSNLIGSFFSSFVGAGSFNRTNVALAMGAATPISAMLSSILVVMIILLLQPLLVEMPMPTMSAILFLVGAGMVKPKKLKESLRTKEDVVMFWLTYLVVMLIGLKAGIGIAILLSIVVFLLHANQLEITDIHPADFQVITIHGNFFYASIDQLLPHFEQRKGNLILNLDFVAYFDDTAAEYVQQEYALRAALGYHLLVVTPAQRHTRRLQRTGKNKKVEIFESYAKARTALEVISVNRFFNSQKKSEK